LTFQNAVIQTNIQKAYHESITALIQEIQTLAPNVFGRNQRIGLSAVRIGRIIGLGRLQLERLKLAAHLHDISRIGVDEDLLAHGQEHSQADRQALRAQIAQAEAFLQSVEYLRDIAPVVRSWPELYDGSGLPDGLRGEMIPLESRILAVAEAFDAMTALSTPPLTRAQALERLRQAAGSQFDPEIVETLAKDVASSQQAETIGPPPGA
jgi:HD-GYP domain-containing protein (c-di-GMP phosphodiesterase class II)